MEKHKQPIIETKNLSKTYGQVNALKSLNLKVPKNSIFGFLGPNGAGKTTTMKILLGLAHPSSGSGTIFGLDIVRDSVAIRERIGYLPQHPRFIDYMTPRQLLDFNAKFYFRGPQKLIDERIDEMLELVGLEDKADRAVRGFSGGEKQRMGIALAQINYPDLLILDEPAAALDPLGRHQVLEVMDRLRKYTTIFYSTHILDDVQNVSDTVAILNHGELVSQGPIEQLLNNRDGMVYSVTTRGQPENLSERMNAISWISRTESETRNGFTCYQITVTDDQAAEAQLLRRILSDPNVVVTDFNRKKYELEEVFIEIIEGKQNDSK